MPVGRRASAAAIYGVQIIAAAVAGGTSRCVQRSGGQQRSCKAPVAADICRGDAMKINEPEPCSAECRSGIFALTKKRFVTNTPQVPDDSSGGDHRAIRHMAKILMVSGRIAAAQVGRRFIPARVLTRGDYGHSGAMLATASTFARDNARRARSASDDLGANAGGYGSSRGARRVIAE